jgi:hypothetical protein
MIAGASSIAPRATTQSIDPDRGHSVSWLRSGRFAVSSWSTRSFAHPIAKQILRDRLGRGAAGFALRLVQRVFIAEAALWMTAAVCALAGFPAALTAFSVALVAFVLNCWLALRTLGPLCRNLWRGGHV